MIVIEGTTDFIFGPEEHGLRIVRKPARPTATLQLHPVPAGQEYGYVFNKCKLTAEPGVTRFIWSRPWRPYAATPHELQKWAATSVLKDGTTGASRQRTDSPLQRI